MPNSTASRIQTLKKVPLFAELAGTELELLASVAMLRHYRAGEMVFSEGEPCAGLYVVESGAVRIFKVSPSGREQVLSIDGPGASIAELPVFDGGNYPASASAEEESDLLFVRCKDIQALIIEHPEVALKVLRVVSGRLRRLVSIVEELSFSTVHHRLAVYLLREARSKGKRTEGGVEFRLDLSNQDLASHIGTVRELVSRNLSRLQSAGLIKLDGRNVIIPDLEALGAEVRNEE